MLARSFHDDGIGAAATAGLTTVDPGASATVALTGVRLPRTAARSRPVA
ncbi:hypothetical protein ACIBBG_19955 [Micromonospora chersina]